MRLCLILLNVCLLAPIAACAQPAQGGALRLNPAKRLSQYDHRVWTTGNGLASNSVEDIAYDANHYLWLGTFGGLSRFDGTTFKTYGSHNVPAMHNNAVVTLAIDRFQRLWIGTQAGIVIMQDGNFYRDSLLRKIDSAFISRIWHDDKGDTWIGTSNGLWLLQDDKLQAVPEFVDQPVSMIRQDAAGTLWVGTESGMLCRRGPKAMAFTALEMPPGTGDVQCLFRDQRGRVWVGAYGGVMQVQDNRCIPYPSLKDVEIFDIQGDTVGNIWMCGNVLVRIPATGDPEIFRGIRYQLNQMVPDPSGLVWMGTENGGLHCLSEGLFLPYSTSEGMRANVARALCEADDHSLWIGYEEGGIDELRDGKVSPVPGISGDLRVKHLMRDRSGIVWISTYDGLFRKSGQNIVRWAEAARNIPDNSIRLTYEDQAGNLWIGTRLSGLYCRTAGGEWQHFTTETSGLGANFIMALCEGQNGDMLVGSKGGLDVLRQGKVVKHLGMRDGLPGNLVFSIRPDGKTGHWLAVQGGLVHYGPAGLRSYTQRHGLQSNACYDVLLADGYLWVPTQAGIMQIREQELLALDPASGHQVSPVCYGRGDGLKEAECIGAAFSLQTRSQQLWFLTNGGAVQLDPMKVTAYRLPNAVYIEGLHYEGVTKTFNAGLMTIPPQVSRFSITFSAIDYLAPERLQFRYKCPPFEDDWVYVGAEREVSFTNLSHGRYTFWVEASSDGRHWRPASMPLTLIQQQPLHKRWWFQVGILLLVLATGMAIYWLRVRSIERSKYLLEAEVEIRTAEIREQAEQIAQQNDELRTLSGEKNYMMSILAHDVRTPLNHIRGLVDVIFTDAANLTEMQRNFLTKIGKSAEKLGELTSQLLDIRSIEANALSIELSEEDVVPIAMLCAESFRSDARRKGIEIDFQADVQQALALCNRDYLKLVLDNLMSNAIKFSPSNTRIRLSVLIAARHTAIAVADEGPGILPEDMPRLFGRFQRLSAQPTGGEKSVGLGLSIVKKYVETMNGNIRVESEPGKGATFVVAFPRP